MEGDKMKAKVDKNVLDLFYKIGNPDVNGRLKATSDLLFVLLNNQDKTEQEKFSREVGYCLDRLVKGLSSSREACRLGYCILLTQVIKHVKVVKIEDVLELIKKHLSLSGKQDRREVVFAQLFACSALVRSGKLASDENCVHVFTNLFELLCGRYYIIKACYEVILDLFSQLSSEMFKEHVWPTLKKKLSGWDSCSADLMWLLCLSYRLFPDVVSAKYLRKHWGTEDLFGSDNYDHLKKLIKQTSSILPTLHPMCLEFVSIVKRRKDVAEIWNAVIDGNLYDSEKAFIAYEMVKLMLEDCPKRKLVKVVLSPEFCTYFSKSFLNSKHPLHPAALSLAEFLCTYVKENKVPKIQLIVLKAFIQPPGTSLMDHIFKKKEVILIIKDLLPDAVKEFCEIMKGVIVKPKIRNDDEVEVNDKKRLQAVSQLVNMVMNPVMIPDIEWRLDIIKFLLLHSFFNVTAPILNVPHCDQAYTPPSEAVRNACISSFYRAVHSLHLRSETRSSRYDFLQHLLHLIEYVEQLISAPDQLTATFSVDGVQNTLAKIKSIVNKLKKLSKTDDDLQENAAFQVLFLHLGLMLFEDPGGIAEIILELDVCCRKFLKSRKSGEDVSDEEPPWIAVVLDIMLSLLSKPSSNLRHLVTSVFPLFCSFMNEENLKQIFDVINPQANTEDLMVIENDDEDEVEFVSGSSSEESDGEDVESETPHPTEDDEFRKKLQDALGSAADDSDAESIALSDSEMFQMDDALNKAFEAFRKKGGSKSTEEKDLIHFQARCFDLILMFLETEPPLKMVLACIEPVFEAYVFGHRNRQQNPVVEKALSTLNIISKIRKFKNTEDVKKSDLKKLFNLIMLRCHKELDLTIARKLYSLCTFMVLCYRRLESSDEVSKKVPVYIKWYNTALDAFVTEGKSHMSPQFFTLFMGTCPNVAWHFIDPCKNYAFNEKIRLFKRTQCLGLLSEALKFSKSQKEISAKKWIKLGHEIFPLASESLKTVLSGSEIKQFHFTELLNIICVINNVVKEKSEENLLLKYSEISNTLNEEAMKIKKTNKRCRTLARSILLASGSSRTKEAKDSEDEETDFKEKDEKNANSSDVINMNNEGEKIKLKHKKRKCDS